MPKIDTVFLRCLAPIAQREFYCKVLGMTELADETVGYGGQEARLSFVQSKTGYTPSAHDLYWKIAIAVPNIELACQQLIERGVAVGQPHQFQDIGYLAHFTDPEGFIVELIEHWFQGERQDDVIDANLLGGGAHFNLLTLRTADIGPVIDACEQWSMTPLSIQPVVEHGFTLYFYAFTNDSPPSPNLYAVENRPWLYQRRYTVLEIQHVHAATTIKTPAPGEAGYDRTVFSDLPNSSSSDEHCLGVQFKALT